MSVSRAARHGLPNLLFQAPMVPAATLQGLVWVLAARWLHDALGPAASARWLAVLGGTAVVAAALGGAWKDRVEHLTEWWGSLIFVLGFLALSALWHRLRLCITLASAPS